MFRDEDVHNYAKEKNVNRKGRIFLRYYYFCMYLYSIIIDYNYTNINRQ